MTEVFEGSCLCGTIKYQTRSRPKAVSHCHCNQCRKSHGAAFASYGSVLRIDLHVIQGRACLESYQSSDSVLRQFCQTCGASLFWSNTQGKCSDWISIALGTLDTKFTSGKQKHVEVASHAPWYEICDDWTQSDQALGIRKLPSMGGLGETRTYPWQGCSVYRTLGNPPLALQKLTQLCSIIANDPVRMRILRMVKEQQLPDCWVAAGFVRSAIWDEFHQRHTSTLPEDVDVIWFDRAQATAVVDAHYETALRSMDSTVKWSVKNQARMHLRNADLPYTSATDAMTYWPETATAIAVRLTESGIEVAAPFGLDDLFDLIVRPTARFQFEKRQEYLKRLRLKNWLATWPDLKILAAD